MFSDSTVVALADNLSINIVYPCPSVYYKLLLLALKPLSMPSLNSRR